MDNQRGKVGTCLLISRGRSHRRFRSFSIEMNSSHCVGSVVPTPSEDDSENSFNKWVVGHRYFLQYLSMDWDSLRNVLAISFMKNVYTTFYLSPEGNGSMIGFAALKKP